MYSIMNIFKILTFVYSYHVAKNLWYFAIIMFNNTLIDIYSDDININ